MNHSIALSCVHCDSFDFSLGNSEASDGYNSNETKSKLEEQALLFSFIHLDLFFVLDARKRCLKYYKCYGIIIQCYI